MFGLSFTEIALVVFLLAIIIGAGKVPQIGESIGAFVAGYRRGAREDDPGIEVRERTRDSER